MDQVTASDLKGMEELMEEIHDLSKDIANLLAFEVRKSRESVSELEDYKQRLATVPRKWINFKKLECRYCFRTWGDHAAHSDGSFLWCCTAACTSEVDNE